MLIAIGDLDQPAESRPCDAQVTHVPTRRCLGR